MNRFTEVLRRLALLIRRNRASRELEEEMRLHRDLRTEALQRAGVDAGDARAAATRRFGNATTAVEASRDEWGFGSFEDLTQDVRYAARRLRQRPGFTFAVVGVLALGIGATTAMFSAVDAAMLRPLPFARPGELLTLTNFDVPNSADRSRRDVSPFDFIDATEMNGLFVNVAAYASGGLNLSDADRPRRVNAGVVTVSFFSTLGVMPAEGRAFDETEGKPGAPNVAIVSWELWQSYYGGSAIVGSTIPLSGKPYQVIGIMPRGFAFPGESDLWIPMAVPTTPATFEPFRGWLPSTLVARVAPGVSLETAETQLLARWAQRVAALPRTPGKKFNIEFAFDEVKKDGATTPFREHLVGDRKRALVVLFGATVLLLLIACANVMSLLLSYGASRRREFAVRSVLGATRARIVRQLLAESVLLSLGGAVAGIALAPAVLSVLRAVMPAALTGLAHAHIDLRVLAFAATLGVITGIGFGLWPAFGATRTDAAAVKSGGGHGASASGMRRLQHALVGAELALTVMLLVGAGLMLRSFDRLMRTESGMRGEGTATLELSFARGALKPAERMARIDAILDRVRSVPGVTSAGAINDLPLRARGGISVWIDVPGAANSETRGGFARYLVASEDYFTTLGIALTRGRFFRASDDASAPSVALVSEAMVKKHWPDTDPVGRTFLFGGDTTVITVVGVVDDVREAGLDQQPEPQMYFPLRRQSAMNVAIVARGALEPAPLLKHLTEAVRTVDRAQAVYNVRMMDDVIGASVASRRANTVLISLFGALALLVSVLGTYAVTSYAVAQRARELGIRSALGATRGHLLRHVGVQMTWVAFVGIAAGAALAWALTRVMENLLFGVTARDIGTFTLAPLVLLIAVAIATMVPARRATRVNPVDVMRAE